MICKCGGFKYWDGVTRTSCPPVYAHKCDTCGDTSYEKQVGGDAPSTIIETILWDKIYEKRGDVGGHCAAQEELMKALPQIICGVIKPLEFGPGGYAHNGLGTMYSIEWDAKFGTHVLRRHAGSGQTGLGVHADRAYLEKVADADNRKRIVGVMT